MVRCSAAGMPMPRSRTAMATRARPVSWPGATSTHTVRVPGEYFTALSSRFQRARPRASLSARMRVRGRRGRAEREFHADAFRGHRALERVDRVAHEFRGVCRCEAVARLAGFHQTEVEQPLDEAVEAAGFVREEFVGALALRFRRQAALDEHAGELAHRRERAAELVRHRRHEIRLQPRHRQFARHRPDDEVAGQATSSTARMERPASSRRRRAATPDARAVVSAADT